MEDGDGFIDHILPPKSGSYQAEEIDKLIQFHKDEIEVEQRKNNDLFDTALDLNTVQRLQGFQSQVNKLQLAILKLQCDISYVKEQYYTVESIKENPIIKERYEMLDEERELKQSLQQLKFKPIVDFFELYASHLEATILGGRRFCSQQTATNIHQLFDWSQYHQVVLLLRACGKAILDMDKFERLYQSSSSIVSIAFKQPLESMQFNNFIEFYDTFSLDTQLVTTIENRGETIDQTLSDLHISDSAFEYKLLGTILTRIRMATVECCRLLVDVNMSYIEAHLTDGINIDKLNGTENPAFSASSQEDNSLPLYALSPQEYITQIGQHLLTLRKHTEQFDASDQNAPLKLALECLQQAQDIPIDVRSYKTVTEVIMRCIARHCIRSLLGRTSNSIVSKLTTRGRRQLATDALYLDNVLEDLRLLDPSEPNIGKFKSLLSQ